MPRYKRSADEADLESIHLDDSLPPKEREKLDILRNMWEFASLMQFIFIFGSAVKLDEDFDVEDLEHECLQPHSSSILAGIGLTLLKYVSSHRGLTNDIFAEYTRRQYWAKAPERNPFGDDEDAVSFDTLDIYTQIKVLHQLSTWTFTNPDRMRSLMPEDDDHLDWRMEPLGWDADDRSYYVLDDNRLYRRTDDAIAPPTPPVKPKKSSKGSARKGRKAAPKPARGTRTSKRRKVEEDSEEEEQDEEPTEELQESEEHIVTSDSHDAHDDMLGYGFTAKTWECVAVTLEEYQDFLQTIQRSRDANEKALRRRIEEEVLPVIEKRAEALQAKQMKKLRELENIQKMATAKRSGRLADKAEKQAKEDEERAAEERKAAELRMAHREQDRQRRVEEGHESRRLTREQRLKEREVKRILHEEELERLEREESTAASQTDTDAAAADRKRLSSRNLQTQRESHRKELDRLGQQEEDDKWYFDCVLCGLHGENLDDGSHSVACERCNVWQHSRCHGFTPEQCENEDFHFICRSCKRQQKAEQANEEQRSGIVLKLGNRSAHSSPSVPNGTAEVKREAVLPGYIQAQLSQSNIAPPVSQQMLQQHPQPAHQHAFAGASHSEHPTYVSPEQKYAGPPTLSPSQHLSPQQHLTGGAPRFPNHTQQHQYMHAQAVNGVGAHVSPHLGRQAPEQSQQFLADPQGQATGPAPLYGSFPARPLASPQHRIAVPPAMYIPQRRTLQAQPSQQPQPAVSPGPQAYHASHGATPRAPSYGANLQTPQAARNHNYDRMASPLQSSPHTAIPPPSTNYNRQAAFSPEKSSPPRAEVQPAPSQAPRPVAVMNGHGPAHVPQTTSLTTPNASFENAPKLATPNKASASPGPVSTAGDSLAASGMKGPWPVESMSVPQKPAALAPSPAQGSLGS